MSKDWINYRPNLTARNWQKWKKCNNIAKYKMMTWQFLAWECMKETENLIFCHTKEIVSSQTWVCEETFLTKPNKENNISFMNKNALTPRKLLCQQILWKRKRAILIDLHVVCHISFVIFIYPLLVQNCQCLTTFTLIPRWEIGTSRRHS